MKKQTIPKRGVKYYLQVCRIFLINHKRFAIEAKLNVVRADCELGIKEIDEILKTL